MLRMLLFLALALLSCACSSKSSEAPAAGAHVIRTLQLNEGKPSHIGFESAHAQGMIEIASDVHIGYQSVTVTPDASGASRQVITLDGKVLDFSGAELKIGERSYGKLSGAVQIQINANGVTVNGEKR
jgi:hypothetical protein